MYEIFAAERDRSAVFIVLNHAMMSIIVCMVTYCIGSARQKREYFKEASGAVVLDNVEVLFCASENGRNYFAFGDVPFGSFTVSEYLSYATSADDVRPSAETVRLLGLQPGKLLSKLCPAEMRIVSFLELTAGRTDKSVVINLDGTRYTRKNNAALKRLLSFVPDAYVCITDGRFLDRADDGYKTLSFGKMANTSKPSFYAAKRLAKKIGAKKVAVM